MNEKNINTLENRIYIRRISNCNVCSKEGDVYTLECKIREYGTKTYRFRSDEDWIQNADNEKLIYLSDVAKSYILSAVVEFEDDVEKLRGVKSVNVNGEQYHYIHKSYNKYDVLKFVDGEELYSQLLNDIPITSLFENKQKTQSR